MKLALILGLYASSLLASSMTVNCHVMSFENGNIQTSDLVSNSSDLHLETYFKGIYYDVTLNNHLIMYSIDANVGKNIVNGVAPMVTKEAPLIVKFDFRGEHELRCFAK